MVTYASAAERSDGTTGATPSSNTSGVKGSRTSTTQGNSVKQYLESIGGDYKPTPARPHRLLRETGTEFLEGYVAIEADRMRNLLLREEDRRPEIPRAQRIRDRRERSVQALDKEIFATATKRIRHHSTIGWRSDIGRCRSEVLRLYDTSTGGQCDVSVIGDVQAGSALALVKKYYGVIPRRRMRSAGLYEEPVQTGPRRWSSSGPASSGRRLSYKSPAASTRTCRPQRLSNILSSGKTSRFYRALTDKNSRRASAPTRDSFTIRRVPDLRVPRAGSGHEQVEKSCATKWRAS